MKLNLNVTKRETELLERIKNTNPIYLHPRHKVIPGRKGKIMGLEEFKKVWEDFCRKKNKGNEIFWDKHFKKDCNISFGCDHVKEIECGELDCGVPWILFSIWRDTDLPVYLFIYPGKDGSPRMYIPTKGNVFYLEGTAAISFVRDGDEYYYAGAIIDESELWKDYNNLERCNVAEKISKNNKSYQGLLNSVAYNINWMEEEFENRIIAI